MTDQPREAEQSLTEQLASVAAYVANLPRGDRAELRRLGRHKDRIPPAVFWRIVDRYDIASHAEPFWQAILPLMVEHPHNRGRRPGRALAEATVSQTRVERWLRFSHPRALDEAHRLLSQVESGFDWVSFGYLLRGWKEKARRQFARDYFLSAARLADRDDEGDDG